MPDAIAFLENVMKTPPITRFSDLRHADASFVRIGQSESDTAATITSETRRPHYDYHQNGNVIDLTVFLPGVDAAGVEIVVRGPDLRVVGHKGHVVRVNFAAAHLEQVQTDYELLLRLGLHLDYNKLIAKLEEGVLTLHIPIRSPLARAA